MTELLVDDSAIGDDAFADIAAYFARRQLGQIPTDLNAHELEQCKHLETLVKEFTLR